MYSMVGREYVLSVLAGYLDATLKGSGACILLEGPMGIGKSRMLRAVALEGALRGLAVTYIRAGARNDASIVRELIIFLRHITRGQHGFSDRELEDLVRPDANPFLLADVLGEMIEEAARRRPLLIILDDAQQADEVSSVALQGLVRSLASAPVLSLLARRPMPANSLAQHAIGWLCEHATVHLRLEPLDNESVAALCGGFLGAKPDASVLAWAARCGGNPWLLEALMSALMEAGRLVVVDGTACVLAEQLPACVVNVVDRLLDSVPPGVRNLLVQAGKVGPRFRVEDLALAGEPASELSARVDEAMRLGLVHKRGTELAFVHEVIGEAVRYMASHLSVSALPSPSASASPSPSASPSLSPAPSASSSPSPSPSVSLSPSLSLSPAPSVSLSPSSSPVQERRPGQAGVDGAQPPTAQRQTSEPLAVVTPLPWLACGCERVSARVISALGDQQEAPRRLARALCLLAGVGRGAEATRLADVAVQVGLHPAAEEHLVLGLVSGLQNAGHNGNAIEHLRRALLSKDFRHPEWAGLERLAVQTAGRTVASCAAGQPAGHGYPAVSGPAQLTRDDFGSGVTGPKMCGPEPDRPHDGVCQCPSWAWMISALIAVDQFGEAAAVTAAVRQAAQTQGEPWSELRWHGHQAELLATLGRLDEARLAAEHGLRVSGRSASQESVPARALLARISLHDGDTAAAYEHLRNARRLLTDDIAADKVRLDWAYAQYHAAGGRAEAAVQRLINVKADLGADLLLFAESPTAAATLVRLAMKAGLEAEAECAADLARQVTGLNPDVVSLAAGAEHAEGLLHRDMEALRRAVEHYRLSGRPLATGMALEDAAQEEQDNRRRSQAVEMLESALELYLQCGARWDITRVQTKLRRLGAHPAGRQSADRPTSGWGSLTNSELRVVRAIVDGKTNKEAASTLFLSPHTVDSHLRRVFGKLGINTRVELTKHFLTNEAA